ncbi:iron-sulfur cluster carrier protein [Kordiimonas sediminis]|uniref:Iron-sulfur cluster carrier protein n=1 Tax=Kordiimonas sediminis TaxID=1735581 RepID=A0A919AX95_9PROT|nr:Mrp/NBP35 family ATP-binding protein [Kordiimonas sediminis]GHF30746.1 iron-sulfur cluster carrier protein [Kordiimonas sediminis]
MTMPTKQDIRSALSKLILVDTGKRLDLLDSVSRIIIDEGSVGIVLDFHDNKPDNPNFIREAAEKAVAKLEGVKQVNVVLTATRAPGAEPSKPTRESRAPDAGGPPKPPSPSPIPGVKHVIAVASGKGGVGKSTTSINIALALQEKGLSVGILDADIFGPSLPTLLGTKEKPAINNGVIEPVKSHNLKAMSIGFLVDTDQPVVWRGPRVMGATQQMLRDVAWRPLDILVVDMPPGTGDVQLTMVQQVPLSGAVIVSTPQDLSLIDARKGLAMFQKVGVPILGIVENMSTFHCPNCGHESHIFGHGGAKETAEELSVPFLGGIPLDPDVRARSDAGTPVVTSAPNTEAAKAYKDIAASIQKTLKLKKKLFNF